MRAHVLEVGSIFAERYEILSTLGRGGMGMVYRARHLDLAKVVALKILAPRRGTGDDHARFAREARAIARLDHPGCVRVLDHGRGVASRPLGRALPSPYIAMELLEGETLATALQAGRFEPGRAIAITRQLLSALGHAHGQGVIHRDLKPENVMLVHGASPRAIDRPASYPTRVVLIDFGLAALHDEAALTAAGMCVGSPSYLAPERLLGKPHDARTDLYAAGVILYEMLAGAPPFAGGSPEETMQLALHRPPRPLRALHREIPAALDAVVARAMAKDPARRFADAEDMRLALVDADELAPGIPEAGPDDPADAAETFAELARAEPSPWARLWARLRYGGWRWRASRARG